MTIYKIRYIAAILFIISPFVAFAQQQAGDSISIFELIDAVEKNTSCRIYTTIAEPFKVKKAETLKPTAESLRQALTATRYKVTVYGNRIFVLPEAFLSTSHAYSDLERRTDEGRRTSLFFYSCRKIFFGE